MTNEPKNYNVREIISNVLAAVGMNGPAFSKAIGLPYTVVYNLQSGRTKKFRPAIVDPMIKAFPKLNLEYLYTGEGDVLRDVVPEPQPQPQPQYPESIDTIVSLQQQIFTKLDELNKKESALNEKERQLNIRELELMKREAECEMQERKLNLQKAVS